MTSHFVELTDSVPEKKVEDLPKPPSVPRFTFLIMAILSILSSIVLLGLSSHIVAYNQSNDARYGRTKVRYEYRAHNGTARNETGFINNLPRESDDDSFILCIAVSSYCIILFILLAILIWRPADRSPFMNMGHIAKSISFSLIGLAAVAQIGSAAYALVDDGRSGTITAGNLHKYENGTYNESFAPASWNCQLRNFADDPSRLRELGGLCSEAKAALAFTLVCSFFTCSALVIMIWFMMALRRRKAAIRPVSQELTQEQQGEIQDFLRR